MTPRAKSDQLATFDEVLGAVYGNAVYGTAVYGDKGRPALPIRLLVGLNIVKYMKALWHRFTFFPKRRLTVH